MLGFKNSALTAVAILSFLAFSFGIAAAALIPDAFSQDLKAGIGVSAFAFLFGISGAVVFAWTCKTWWNLHWLKNHGVAAKGAVTSKVMASGKNRLYEFYINYEFIDREGKKYQGRVTIPGPIGLSWSEGHEVNVLYDPDNPKKNIATERWLKIGE